jgi:hypothetical protein
MIPCPPLWRPSRRGDGLRRRLGPAELALYRREGRGGYFLAVTLRLAAHDPAEAAVLAEAVAASWLQAHGAADTIAQRSA